MNSEMKSIGLVMVLRDYKWNILFSACCNKPTVYSPMVAEAVALRKAMLISHDLGLTQVIFEGDCKVDGEENSGEIVKSEIYVVLHDIRVLLSHQPTWNVKFDYIETNKVAHNLATLACTMHGHSIWMEECPM